MNQFAKGLKVNCLYCGGEHVIKDGWQVGKQRYRCRDCGKRFINTGAIHGRRMSTWQIGTAIALFYSGMSYKQIAESMADMYDIPEPSKATIYGWVKDYTIAALEEMKNHPARTGGEWVAGEMRVKVGGKRLWNWNIMDRDTRYMLASHLTVKRDAAAAEAVMRKAAKASVSPPRIIKTYKLRPYKAAIKHVFRRARHIRSRRMGAEVDNDLSEGLQRIQRQRAETLSGLYHQKSGQLYLDGWTLTYNLFREHEALEGKKPGEAAEVGAPFKEWADVARMDVAGKRGKDMAAAGAVPGVGNSGEPVETTDSKGSRNSIRYQTVKRRRVTLEMVYRNKWSTKRGSHTLHRGLRRKPRLPTVRSGVGIWHSFATHSGPRVLHSISGSWLVWESLGRLLPVGGGALRRPGRGRGRRRLSSGVPFAFRR